MLLPKYVYCCGSEPEVQSGSVKKWSVIGCEDDRAVSSNEYIAPHCEVEIVGE